MALWIPVTILAAFVQNLRFLFQKRLTEAGLGPAAATLARFLYSSPVVLAVALALAPGVLVRAPAAFWGWAILGGTAQILATVCVMRLFGLRNFAVGMMLKRTEVLMAVLWGWVLLGDAVSWLALAAILTGVLGVLIISAPPEGRRGIDPATLALGLAAGLLFGISGNGYRGASLALEATGAGLSALVTLAAVTTMQTIALCAWLASRDRPQLVRTLQAWRVGGLVGLTSMVGSYCWFLAFSLQAVGYVNALGQVEVLFSIFTARLVFGEAISRREYAGLALLTASILALVLVTGTG